MDDLFRLVTKKMGVETIIMQYHGSAAINKTQRECQQYYIYCQDEI